MFNKKPVLAKWCIKHLIMWNSTSKTLFCEIFHLKFGQVPICMSPKMLTLKINIQIIMTQKITIHVFANDISLVISV